MHTPSGFLPHLSKEVEDTGGSEGRARVATGRSLRTHHAAACKVLHRQRWLREKRGHWSKPCSALAPLTDPNLACCEADRGPSAPRAIASAYADAPMPGALGSPAASPAHAPDLLHNGAVVPHAVNHQARVHRRWGRLPLAPQPLELQAAAVGGHLDACGGTACVGRQLHAGPHELQQRGGPAAPCCACASWA